MQITNLYCEFARTELHSVDVYSEGQMKAWPETELQPDLQKLTIFDNEWASISLSVWGVPFAVVIGQTQRRAGLLVTHSTSSGSPEDEQKWL